MPFYNLTVSPHCIGFIFAVDLNRLSDNTSEMMYLFNIIIEYMISIRSHYLFHLVISLYCFFTGLAVCTFPDLSLFLSIPVFIVNEE